MFKLRSSGVGKNKQVKKIDLPGGLLRNEGTCVNMVAHAWTPRIQKVETGRSGVQGHPELDSEWKDTLGYMRPCNNNNNDSDERPKEKN